MTVDGNLGTATARGAYVFVRWKAGGKSFHAMKYTPGTPPTTVPVSAGTPGPVAARAAATALGAETTATLTTAGYAISKVAP